MRPKPTPPELIKRLGYDSSSPTGLIWVKPTSRRTAVGSVAGCYFNGGYYRVHYQDKTYSAHRLVWELHAGPLGAEWDVDHRDTIKTNNDITNLRLATHSQNQHNQNMTTKNQHGVKGLVYSCGSWIGLISSNGIPYKFRSEDRDEVEAWLLAKRKELHGVFARN